MITLASMYKRCLTVIWLLFYAIYINIYNSFVICDYIHEIPLIKKALDDKRTKSWYIPYHKLLIDCYKKNQIFNKLSSFNIINNKLFKCVHFQKNIIPDLMKNTR